MATSNIFDYNVTPTRSPRNAFDISYSSLFSTPCGMLLPAYVEDVKANDTINLDVTCETRTRPINTSAFQAFDQKIDFYFVPYRLLWSAYKEFRISQAYPHSTSSLKDPQNQYLLPSSSWQSLSAALLKAPELSTNGSLELYNPAYALRLLDMLGYFAVSDTEYSLIKNTTSLAALAPGTEHPFASLISAINGICSGMDTSGLRLNYFRLAAYQCICNHCYRNSEYEALNPSLYNCDSLFLSNSNSPTSKNTIPTPTNVPASSTPTYLVFDSSSDSIDFKKLLTVRFKNWRKDLFTSARPSTGISKVLGIDVPESSSNGSSFDWSIPTSGYVTGDTNTYRGRYLANGNNAQSRVFSVNQLLPVDSNNYAHLYAQNVYNLMAQDKFAKSIIYGKKDLDEQLRLLLGENYDEPNDPVYLGTFENTVSISDVVATSAGSDAETDASTSVLGQIAGKGYSQGKGQGFKYHFKEDGVVLGMHYLMPRNNYDSYRTNRFNTKVSRFDYYFPMFDGLGLSPIYMYERGFYNASGGVPTSLTTLFGFGPRYFEYKSRQSETHGSFMYGQSDYDWTLSNNYQGNISASSVSNYKIYPNITDRIFSVAYDGSLSTDPFYCYFFFNATRVSDLEQIGVPNL